MAAFDLLGTTGGPVFLTVNPDCGWLWAEQAAGQRAVSAAVLDLVAAQCRPEPAAAGRDGRRVASLRVRRDVLGRGCCAALKMLRSEALCVPTLASMRNRAGLCHGGVSSARRPCSWARRRIGGNG
ncbi:hypothetical protein ACFXPA_48340 [Amycolatopsis sp. NPDC059090]|uniref:hypothetical protein n=1 Tax=Amycolatopsis sp. NPDC059090 TaxID=3346723 RepID=UPI0036730665